MASAEKLVLRGHRAYKAQQDLKEYKENEGLRERKEYKAKLALKEKLALKVLKGKKETPLRMKTLRKNSYLI